MDKSPVSSAFFATSIIGFLISVTLTYTGRINYSLGFASTLVFLIMFIASFVSMTPSHKEIKELNQGSKVK